MLRGVCFSPMGLQSAIGHEFWGCVFFITGLHIFHVCSSEKAYGAGCVLIPWHHMEPAHLPSLTVLPHLPPPSLVLAKPDPQPTGNLPRTLPAVLNVMASVTPAALLPVAHADLLLASTGPRHAGLEPVPWWGGECGR